MKTQIADLTPYQSSLISLSDREKTKRKNLIMGYLTMLAFDLAIIIPIAIYYYSTK